MTKNESTAGSSNRIQAVENVFELIERMQDFGDCGVRELAAHMGIPKSTAHIYLKTLEKAGYVVKREGSYRLSNRFLEVGGQIRQQSKVYQAGREEVDELARATGEVATLGIEENGYRVMLYRTEPSGGLFNNAPTGEYTHMHWTAVGKALLSQKPDDEIRRIVDQHGLPNGTEQTIIESEALFEEIETIRKRGYSIENEERVSGVKSVAVPIESNGNIDDAAISVAGPKHEFGTESIREDLLPELRNTANVVELKTRHY